MPEGHTIHRLAEDYAQAFRADPALRVTSPQGKFSDAAALLDRTPLHTTDAHGKHLFLGFGDPGHPEWVHIHLGLFGKVTFGPRPGAAAHQHVRLRLAGATAYVDLRGPTTCALITEPEKRAVHDRLGPDPLRPDADPDARQDRMSSSCRRIIAVSSPRRCAWRPRSPSSRPRPAPTPRRARSAGRRRRPPTPRTGHRPRRPGNGRVSARSRHS
ncbi:hypothetical protein STENM223S_11743 [Streptomyces tendae]